MYSYQKLLKIVLIFSSSYQNKGEVYSSYFGACQKLRAGTHTRRIEDGIGPFWALRESPLIREHMALCREDVLPLSNPMVFIKKKMEVFKSLSKEETIHLIKFLFRFNISNLKK